MKLSHKLFIGFFISLCSMTALIFAFVLFGVGELVILFNVCTASAFIFMISALLAADYEGESRREEKYRNRTKR